MNFIETILPESLDNSLAVVKGLLVKNSMALKILEILSEVIFIMLLGPGNFLACGPNRFVRIWCEIGRC